MKEWLAAALILAGAAFTLLAAVGLVRMPDLFTRMHTTSKASTLGAGCLLLAAAILAGNLSVTTRALAGIVFLFLTAPVGAHVIARAGYLMRVPVWPGTVCDELRGRYDSEDSGGAGPDACLGAPGER